MITLLDKVLFLHPGIQGVVYWNDPNPLAPSADPYERLLWDNKDIPKPTKAALDAITDLEVEDAKKDEQRLQLAKQIEESDLFKLLNHLRNKPNNNPTRDDIKQAIIDLNIVP
jgi:hypothetical protein